MLNKCKSERIAPKHAKTSAPLRKTKESELITKSYSKIQHGNSGGTSDALERLGDDQESLVTAWRDR